VGYRVGVGARRSRGSFSAAYTGARGDATQTALAAEQIAATLYRFAGSFKQERPWVGTTTELLAELNDRESDESLKRSRAWPKDASNLGRRLKSLAPSLAEVGVYVGDAQYPAGGAEDSNLLQLA
jgi:hypothetical protein